VIWHTIFWFDRAVQHGAKPVRLKSHCQLNSSREIAAATWRAARYERKVEQKIVILVAVLFIGLDVSSLTAVRTLACGTDRLLTWGRCFTGGTGISLGGRAEDTFLLFPSVTALFIPLKSAELFFDTIYCQ
jgi:hypothetical protein